MGTSPKRVTAPGRPGDGPTRDEGAAAEKDPRRIRGLRSPWGESFAGLAGLRLPLPLALLAVAVTWAYLTAAPTAVQPGDGGELATVALRGGIPHPPGYPWVRMLGPLARLAEPLAATPMWAAALVPSLAGAASFVLVARAAATTLHAPVAGPALAALAALSPLAIAHVPDAEVWGLHLLLCALFVVAALDPRPPPGPRRAATLGVLLGLAASHHQTAVWLTPLAVGAAWPHGRSGRELLRALVRDGAVGLGAVAVGLTPYLTLMIGRGGAWRWGDVSTFDGWLHHVLRADYGTFSLGLQPVTPPATLLLGRQLASLGDALTAGALAGPALGALALAAGLLAAARGRPRGVTTGAWWGLLASFLVAGPAFTLAHNLDPRSPFSRWILERFDLLPLLLAVPLLAPSLARLGAALLGRLPPGAPRLRLRRLLLAAALLLPAAQLLRTEAGVPPARRDAVERYARQILLTPPPQADTVIVGLDDHRTFPVLYLQAVAGLAPRVLYVDASLLSQAWYRAWLRRRAPWLPEIDRPVRLISSLLSSPGRAPAVYVTHVFSRPAASLPLVPEGALWRVAPDLDLERAKDRALTLRRHGQARERLERAGVPLLPPPPAGEDPWTDEARGAAFDPSRALARALAAAGEVDEARALLAPP